MGLSIFEQEWYQAGNVGPLYNPPTDEYVTVTARNPIPWGTIGIMAIAVVLILWFLNKKKG